MQRAKGEIAADAAGRDAPSAPIVQPEDSAALADWGEPESADAAEEAAAAAAAAPTGSAPVAAVTAAATAPPTMARLDGSAMDRDGWSVVGVGHEGPQIPPPASWSASDRAAAGALAAAAAAVRLRSSSAASVVQLSATAHAIAEPGALRAALSSGMADVRSEAARVEALQVIMLLAMMLVLVLLRVLRLLVLTFTLQRALDGCCEQLTGGRERRAARRARLSLPAEQYERSSLLGFGASCGFCSVVECMLRAGADVEVRSAIGWTPLMEAARSLQVPAMALLLGAGARTEPTNAEGMSALQLLRQHASPPELVGVEELKRTEQRATELLESVAAAQQLGKTVASAEDLDVALAEHMQLAFLRERAEVEGRERAESEHAEAGKRAEAHRRRNESEQQKLERGRQVQLRAAAGSGHVGKLRELLTLGVDVECCNFHGTNALMMAVQYSGRFQVDAVLELLRAGARTEPQNRAGRNALDCALLYQRRERHGQRRVRAAIERAVHVHTFERDRVWSGTDEVAAELEAPRIAKRERALSTLGAWASSFAVEHYQDSTTSAQACARCGRNFDLLRRKHHCRSCGDLVCDDCSLGRRFMVATLSVS